MRDAEVDGALAVLGVGPFEEQVYRALVRLPEAPAPELSAEVGAGETAVEHALKRLEQLGLIRSLSGGRHVLVSPETAIDLLIQRRRTELDQARALAAQLAEEYRVTTLQTQLSGLIEVVTGRESVDRRATELHYSSRSSVLTFDMPPYSIPEERRPSEVEMQAPVMQRGVEFRSIYSRDALGMPGRYAQVLELVKAGEQARTLPELPLKLHIYDHRLALIPLTGSSVPQAMAVIHDSGMLDALIALFDAYWERATPISLSGPPPDAPGEALGPDEAQVLSMLAAGLTDQAIARQLGVSLRTARRRIALVMDHTQASTRFQAGVVAARRGLV